MPLFTAACGDNSSFRDKARAIRITTESERIGGPDAVGWVGDFLLSNSEIRVIVQDVGTSWGPGFYGGSIVDADLVRKARETQGGTGLDQFSEMFPTINILAAELRDSESASVSIINDGSDGKPAVVRMEGEAAPYLSLLEGEQVISQNHYFFTTDYILPPEKKYVIISTSIALNDPPPDFETLPSPDSEDPIKLFINLLLGNEVLGDIFMPGMSVDIFSPVFGFDEMGYLIDKFDRGESTFISPVTTDYLACVADQVSYGYCSKEGAISIPLFASSVTVALTAVNRDPHPRTVSFQRYFIVGDGDVGSVVDTVHEIRGTPVGRLKGNVLEDHTLESATHVSVLVFPDPRTSREQPIPSLSELGPPVNQFLTDVGEDPVLDGSFSGTLPEGHYLVLAHTHDRTDRPPTPVTIRSGKTTEQDLLIDLPGRVIFEVRDYENRLVPSKITFWGIDPVTGEAAQVPYPEYGDGFLPEQISKIAYTHTGKGEVMLEPGVYRYAVSRGFEYSIDEGQIEVTWRRPARLYAHIAHQVDTRGWMSADFHVHCKPSFDSGVEITERIVCNVAEHMEIYASTDHDYILNAWPKKLELGLEDYIYNLVSDELTTVEMGHFIGYPLRWEPWQEQNGAPDWLGCTPTQIFNRLRMQGSMSPLDTIIHITHPRDSIFGYFYMFGLDQKTGRVAENGSFMAVFNDIIKADNWDLNFEVIEILNSKRLEMIRTPTTSEANQIMACADNPSECPDIYELMSRTQGEQAAILDGTDPLSEDYLNILDDWFMFLNMGMKYTATAGSDAHSKVKTESGCCRNYLRFSTDEPRGVTDREIVDRVKGHEVVVTYGPFVEVWANDNPIGSTVYDPDGETDLRIRIQSPTWMELDRVELYANGILIDEFSIPVPNPGVICFDETIVVRPSIDTWYAVLTMGRDDMSPVVTANEFPQMQVGQIVYLTLSSLGTVFGDPEFPVHIPESLIPIVESLLKAILPPAPPSVFPIHPYAQTNPIWVDVDGDMDGDGDPFEGVNKKSSYDSLISLDGLLDADADDLMKYVANPAFPVRFKRVFGSHHPFPRRRP